MTDLEFWKAFPQIAEDALKLNDAASVGIGVIKDGEVVFVGGFGDRDIENGLKADKDTLYQIGSCSKAFTCAVIGKLVDEGLVDWNTPVRKYCPDIVFYDDFANDNVTMIDLLAHRTGLPRHEFSWYGTNFTRDELVEHVRYFEPSQEIRARMQYCNYGTVLAAHVAEKLTGKTWEQLLQEYIFDPCGMTRSTAFIEDIENDPNHAVPYDRETGKFDGRVKIPFYKTDVEDKSKGIGAPFGPAGSINSTPVDMLKWVNMHLNKGKVGEKQVLSEAVVTELHKPQILRYAPLDMPHEETEFRCYALGWFAEMFRGHKFLQHGGNINGFSGFTGFVPDLNLGIVAYANINGTFLHFALARTIIDHYLGIEDGNWVQRYYDFLKAGFEASKGGNGMKPFTGEQVEGTTPSRDLAGFVGTYSRPGYDKARIALEDDKLVMYFNGFRMALKHYHYDTFVTADVAGELPDGLPLHFHTADIGGDIDSFGIPLVMEEGGKMVVFKKETA